MSGERFTFLKTAADTNGELLQFELVLRPGGRIPIVHRHAAQEEVAEIVEGFTCPTETVADFVQAVSLRSKEPVARRLLDPRRW